VTTEAAAPPEHIAIREPPQPRHARQAGDVVRLASAMTVVLLVAAFAAVADDTAAGLNTDILSAVRGIPEPLAVPVFGLFALSALLFLPVLVIRQLTQRRFRRLGLYLLAFALTVIAVSLFGDLVGRGSLRRSSVTCTPLPGLNA
jgi:hypothetical protein